MTVPVHVVPTGNVDICFAGALRVVVKYGEMVAVAVCAFPGDFVIERCGPAADAERAAAHAVLQDRWRKQKRRAATPSDTIQPDGSGKV